MGIEAWSTTASSNNSSPPNGWPEGQAASSVNDCARQMMASIRAWFEDAQWVNLNHTPTRIDNDTFTVATDLTALYHAGRRLKLTGGSTGYATIASSSYSAPDTTVNVTMDSGNLPNPLSAVYLSILTLTNASVPPAIGANLTSLNASNLASGTVPDARFPSTLPAISGANLTNLNASNLASGSIPNARVTSGNVTQHQSSINSGVAIATSQVTSGTFADARVAQSNVTQHQAALSLATSQISSGTMANARIASSNVTQFFSQSLLTNGYIVLPNGLYIQWGRTGSIGGFGGTETVSFPIAFPNNCFTVVSMSHGVGGSAQSESYISSIGTSSFVQNNSGTTTKAFGWVAFGN